MDAKTPTIASELLEGFTVAVVWFSQDVGSRKSIVYTMKKKQSIAHIFLARF